MPPKKKKTVAQKKGSGKKKPAKTKAVVTPKRKVGRPDEFKPEYCQMLIDHMEDGLSYETFAGKIGVAKGTLYNWEKHKEFLNAKQVGIEKSRLWWEQAGRKGMFTPGFSASVWIFNQKNRFGWVDKKESNDDKHIHTVKIELPGQQTEQVISIEPGKGDDGVTS